MKPKPFSFSVESLRAVLDYNPSTGIFTWKASCHKKRIGRTVGTVKGGYLEITVFGRACQAHRLAWYHYYGTDPINQVDHKDRVRNNNRIENLRIASPADNSHNSGKRRGANKYKGVILKTSGKYCANICMNRKQINLGYYDNAENAAEAYDVMAIQLFGEFCVLNFPEKRKEYDEKIKTIHNKSVDEWSLTKAGLPNGKKSRYIGVGYLKNNKAPNQWYARFHYKKVKYKLGVWSDENSAAKVYDKKALEILGDAAVLNFPHFKDQYLAEIAQSLTDSQLTLIPPPGELPVWMTF